MVVHKVVRGRMDVVVWHRLARCWRLARYPGHRGEKQGGAKEGVPEVVSAAGGNERGQDTKWPDVF